jgi:hypothetical protein
MNRQVRPVPVADRRLIAGLVVVGVLLLSALVWINTQSPFTAVAGDRTISECRPGEDPATALCYRPAEPT